MEHNDKIVPKAGWSWGGLMFNVAFLVGAKRYKLLWWYLLGLVPFVNVIFGLVFAIYLGANGHKIAAEGTQFANQSEYDGYTKGLDHAGKVFFFAALIILALVVALFVTIGIGFGLSALHSPAPLPQ
jgi:predicted PurR-regulated permease PerM